MSAIFYFLLLILSVNLVSSTPSQTQAKCRVSDSDCLTKQTQIKVPLITASVISDLATQLDPLILDVAEYNVAGIQVKFFKAVLQGLKNVIVDSVEINPYAKEMRVVAHTNALAKGRYSVDGSILGFSINQNGEAEINSKNLQVQLVMPFQVIRDIYGRDVIDLTSYKYTFDVNDEVQYNFTNMFNGDKALSDLMHRIINSNSKIITTKYGGPILDLACGKMFNAFRSYLRTQPISDILY